MLGRNLSHWDYRNLACQLRAEEIKASAMQPAIGDLIRTIGGAKTQLIGPARKGGDER